MEEPQAEVVIEKETFDVDGLVARIENSRSLRESFTDYDELLLEFLNPKHNIYTSWTDQWKKWDMLIIKYSDLHDELKTTIPEKDLLKIVIAFQKKLWFRWAKWQFWKWSRKKWLAKEWYKKLPTTQKEYVVILEKLSPPDNINTIISRLKDKDRIPQIIPTISNIAQQFREKTFSREEAENLLLKSIINQEIISNITEDDKAKVIEAIKEWIQMPDFTDPKVEWFDHIAQQCLAFYDKWHLNRSTHKEILKKHNIPLYVLVNQWLLYADRNWLRWEEVQRLMWIRDSNKASPEEKKDAMEQLKEIERKSLISFKLASWQEIQFDLEGAYCLHQADLEIRIQKWGERMVVSNPEWIEIDPEKIRDENKIYIEDWKLRYGAKPIDRLLLVNSATRTPEKQEELLFEYATRHWVNREKYKLNNWEYNYAWISRALAAKWVQVAPPGFSPHNKYRAVDISHLPHPSEKQWDTIDKIDYEKEYLEPQVVLAKWGFVYPKKFIVKWERTDHVHFEFVWIDVSESVRYDIAVLDKQKYEILAMNKAVEESVAWIDKKYTKKRRGY